MKRIHSYSKKLFSKIRFSYVLGSIALLASVFFIAGGLSQAQNTAHIYAEVGFSQVAAHNATPGISPNGLAGGRVVPASCELGYYHDTPWFGSACSATNVCGATNYGTLTCADTCSVGPPSTGNYGAACTSGANSCGQTNAGTYLCNGSCSASTPANPAGYGNACTSSANSCGQTNSGTIQCNSSCSASTPANPSGYGNACVSAANACGQTNSGTIQCNSTCSASTPSNSSCAPPTFYCQGSNTSCSVVVGRTVTLTWSCPSPNTTSSGVGFSTGSAASGSTTVTPVGNVTYTVVCGQTGTQASVSTVALSPSISVSAAPSRVHLNGVTSLTWGATSVTSCVLSGPAGTLASATAVSGTVSSRSTNTPAITGQSVFTVTCQTADTPVSASITITVVPNEQEI